MPCHRDNAKADSMTTDNNDIQRQTILQAAERLQVGQHMYVDADSFDRAFPPQGFMETSPANAFLRLHIAGYTNELTCDYIKPPRHAYKIAKHEPSE